MRWLVVVAIAGCGFRPAAISGGGSGDDASGDGPHDAADAAWGSEPMGSGCTNHAVPPSINVDATQWHAEFLSAPVWNCNAAGTTTINSQTGTVTSTSCTLGGYGVSNGVAQTTGGAPVMVVRIGGLTITNSHKLKITGDRAIVLLVAGNVVVDSGGIIDASASGTTAGPGAAACADHNNGLGTAGVGTNWGGGGGGFGTDGGQGCFNVLNGGLANGAANLQPLRGGCSGGAGDTSFGNSKVPGGGGGAFEISATGSISIGATGTANLVASGGGAPGNNGGGNGGGAGGAILLVSPSAAQLGTGGALRANGGAGSEGCSSSCNNPASGTDGSKTDNTQALDTSGVPGGGNNMDHGRRGGLADLVGASSIIAAPGDMVAAQNGGRGGGGGGGGRVVIATGATTTSCD